MSHLAVLAPTLGSSRPAECGGTNLQLSWGGAGIASWSGKVALDAFEVNDKDDNLLAQKKAMSCDP